jgi:hypothetical protein
MPVRTGVPTLMKTAKALCRALNAFTPLLTVIYYDNTVLLAVLEAAIITCADLQRELAKVREYGD